MEAGLHVHGDDLSDVFSSSIAVRFSVDRESDADAVRIIIRSSKDGLMMVIRGESWFGHNSFWGLKERRAE